MNDFKNILKDKNWFTASNILTLSRVFMTPFIIWGISNQRWLLSLLLVAISGMTDLFDGYLARALNQETYLGKILDPIADKILLISIFASLAFIHSPTFLIPKWFIFFILTRELIILLGSFFLMSKKVSFKVRPTIWGKANTVLELLFISWLFICNFFGWIPVKTYNVLLVILASFAAMVFVQYLRIGLNYLLDKK